MSPATTTSQSSTVKPTAARAGWPRVFLAISSFRNDEAVLSILRSVHKHSSELKFDSILVVDSLGTSAIPTLIDSNCWENVVYRSHPTNLGSAGNLAERLRWAAELGADFVYAVNHDGYVDFANLRLMVEAAQSDPRIGAVYPLRFMSGPRAYNLTGLRSVPAHAKLTRRPPRREIIEVFWSSSNGALYSLAPVREGLLPRGDFWMGWEDLEYGLALADHGYRQVMLREAVFRDDYEYCSRAGLNVVRKPAWYAYYSARNLVLLGRQRRAHDWWFQVVLAFRLFVEYPLIIALRDQKRSRLALCTRGIIDGWRTRTGKVDVP